MSGGNKNINWNWKKKKNPKDFFVFRI